MTRIIEDIEAHYETHEVPFGRIYEWHPEHNIVECDCGERFTLTATSATSTCRCGTDHSGVIREIQKHEGRLPDKSLHPWHHDAKGPYLARLMPTAARAAFNLLHSPRRDLCFRLSTSQIEKLIQQNRPLREC